MAHPEIDNRTPFVVAAIPQHDENFAPAYTVLVKATYDIIATSQLRLAEEQSAVNFAGEYYGEPALSSCKYEPECALTKTRADVVLIGHAYPEVSGGRITKTGFKVGSLQKTALVFGDRIWEKSAIPKISSPQPFEKIALRWENAFGGTDPRINDPQIVSTEPLTISHEPRNPVGKGYADKKLPFPEELWLPNIEDPEHLIKDWLDRPTPSGFGFTAPHWQPRPQLAGTYDEHWEKTRKPLLPADFDRRFFNAASPGLIASGFLEGDEEVIVVNASDRGRLVFRLPGVPDPMLQMKFHRGDPQVHQTRLDTLIVNTDEHQVYLFWRALVPSPKGHMDLAELNLKIPGVELFAQTGKVK